ncbi:hypothetical protein [Halorhabdus amylolytica]|uniref:hypothetical protein n=1 Tax=Halorhabdus amylolytica TaxID=2559573 RepID=UPI0010AA5D73|nr:hypothetical protein [Halorhabdus amylolytica]
MYLNEDRVQTLADRIAEHDLTKRHRQSTQNTYETVFGIETTPEAGREHLDLIFKRVIQARATPLSRDQYRDVVDSVSPENIIEQDTHQEAYDTLRSHQHIAQKIANEFLRQVVDVFGIRRTEWHDQLDVALDTNVVQALVKMGAIVLDDTERERGPAQIVNMHPESEPYKRIGYQEVQLAMGEAAEQAGFPRIVFDELWLEHREFIADPLLQSESKFDDLILSRFQA